MICARQFEIVITVPTAEMVFVIRKTTTNWQSATITARSNVVGSDDRSMAASKTMLTGGETNFAIPIALFSFTTPVPIKKFNRNQENKLATPITSEIITALLKAGLGTRSSKAEYLLRSPTAARRINPPTIAPTKIAAATTIKNPVSDGPAMNNSLGRKSRN